MRRNPVQGVRKYELMDAMAAELGNMCYVCHTPYLTPKTGKRRPGKAFTVHHLAYEADDKTYKDFGSSTKKYWEYLLPIIKDDNTRFMLLCAKHHRVVEMLAHWPEPAATRLRAAVAMMSHFETAAWARRLCEKDGHSSVKFSMSGRDHE